MRQEVDVRSKSAHREAVLVHAVTIGRSATTAAPGQLANLRKRGSRVILMCTPDDDARRHAKSEGVELIPLPMKRGYLAPRDLRSFIHAIRVFRKVKPDLVLVATPKAALIVGLASWLTRVPNSVYELMGLRLAAERRGSLRYRVLWLAEYVSCLVAHVVLLPSEGLRDQAVSAGVVSRGKTRVLGRGSVNGVNLARYRPVTSESRHDARAANGFAPDSMVFAFVGRIVLDKGIDTLVDAFEALPDRLNARLLLVGGFEAEYCIPTELRTRISNNPSIGMTGFVDDTSRWYRVMDVMVMPSRREGLSTVLLEAAAAGLPTITTDATGCGDAVQADVTGVVVPVGDIDALGKAMVALAGSRQQREQMGAAGQKFVARHYDQSVVWSNRADFFEKLMQREQ